MMKQFGIANSPFGRLLLAGSEESLNWLSFVNQSKDVRQILEREFPRQTYSQHDEWSQSIVNQWIEGNSQLIHIAPIGTPFQLVVWNNLMKIPLGTTLSYSELAQLCGHPSAVRATASAVARNPIAIIIPCHRVLPKNGATGNYRWGSDKKQALLDLEARQGRLSTSGG